MRSRRRRRGGQEREGGREGGGVIAECQEIPQIKISFTRMHRNCPYMDANTLCIRILYL